jgi:hypothetical protein
MNAMKKLFLLPLCAVVAIGSFAQGDGISGDQYTVIGDMERRMADVNKKDLVPQSFDTILPTAPLTYQMLQVRGAVPARVDSIEAAKLNIQLSQQKLYKGYAKAGFGLYTTPLFEVYYDQVRNRKGSYGLHFKHMSSNGGIDDVGPSDYSFNQVDAFYSAYLRHHTVDARLTYDRRRVSYYGYDRTDSLENAILTLGPPEEMRKQVYNDIGFAVRLRSNYKDSAKVAHDVGLNVYNYRNLTGSTETNLTVKAALKMEQDSETYGGDVLIDNNAYRAVLGEGIEDELTNGTLLGVSPYVSTSGDKYTVKVGAGMFFDAQGKTTFHFYPQAYLDYHLFDEILVPYVGVNGRKTRNSFRSLTRENPWLTGAPTLQNSNLMYDIYGGLRGSFSSDIGFDVRISKSRVKDRALFTNVQQNMTEVNGVALNAPLMLGDQFAVLYDRIDQLDVSGQITYSHAEHVNVYGRVDIYTYDQQFAAEPWNLPPYSINFGATYDFRDKLLVKLEALFLGARKGVTTETFVSNTETYTVNTSHDLDGFMDLYLGLEYRYTKRLSLFLDVSNLSASKYERWHMYPVQRSLILGGATYSF